MPSSSSVVIYLLHSVEINGIVATKYGQIHLMLAGLMSRLEINNALQTPA